jgi:hypothetical protein
MGPFNVPFGGFNPQSLPGLQTAVSPLQMPGPIPPQQLRPGFRVPPSPGGSGGMPGLPQMQQPQGLQVPQMQGRGGFGPYQGNAADAGIPGSNAAAQNAVGGMGAVTVNPDGTNTTTPYGNIGDLMQGLGLDPSGGVGGFDFNGMGGLF